MRKSFVLVPAILALLSGSGRAAVEPGQDTLFHYAERSFAVGVVHLGKPQKFREGKVLAFPSQITELVWAPKQTKPRNLMLVYEVGTGDEARPYFNENDMILAPIRLLPEHSYWRDNLPNTPRHEIAGGRRYAFRGDEIAEVKQILADYLAAAEKTGKERPIAKLRVVSGALNTHVVIVREDAARYIATAPDLARDFEQQNLAAVATYLAGDAPASEKASVVDALAAAKIAGLKEVLAPLAARDDAVGAAALGGLEALGEQTPADRLLALSRSSSVEMRAYAARSLGSRAKDDEAARKRALEMLSAEGESPSVTRAAATGLGQAGGEPVVAGLAQIVRRGGPGASAASDALAAIGGPSSTAALAQILKETKGEAALAAVSGLSKIEDCADCARILSDQYKTHPDEEVRHLIGVVAGVPLEHKH